MNRKCIFIDIIGSTPDENENTNRINGYYQVTNGILITVGDLNVKRDLNVIAKIFKIFIKNFNILHFSPDIKNLIINEIH